MNGLNIIMYHYVRDFSKSKYRGIKGLDVKVFEKQLEYFKKNYRILLPEEVRYIITANKSFGNKDCWLTFDDGYKDHYQYALPLLDKFSIKASFYPPVKTTNENDVLDVNKIHFILSVFKDAQELLKNIEIKFNKAFPNKFSSFSEIVKKINTSSRYDSKEIIIIKRLLQRNLPENFRKKICNDLFKNYVFKDVSAFAKSLYMNPNEIIELFNNGHEIGIHSYNHCWLGYLSKNEQQKEIIKSLNFWRSLGVINDKWTMCYPYGNYNNDTLNLLYEYNCVLALTTKPKSNHESKYKKYELSRWDANDFLQC